MFPQVTDFRDESEALYALLSPLESDAFGTPTQFKRWTFDDILGHLHRVPGFHRRSVPVRAQRQSARL